MAVMAAVPTIDPTPLIRLIEERGGQCSFEDAVEVFQTRGLTPNDARDAVWRLLSQGVVEFTTDRAVRLRTMGSKVAG